MPKINKSEEDWRKELTPAQYRILRERGTEPPFSGEHAKGPATGVFACAACGTGLFDASTKYDSGSGWPSFTAPVTNEAVDEHRDSSHGMTRTEVVCAGCGGHLGHVFPDGPRPTGLRYCINSLSLKKTDAGKG